MGRRASIGWLGARSVHKSSAKGGGRGLPGASLVAYKRHLTGAPVGDNLKRGRSSGVEHHLAKVGVEGSNPFARSSFLQ